MRKNKGFTIIEIMIVIAIIGILSSVVISGFKGHKATHKKVAKSEIVVKHNEDKKDNTGKIIFFILMCALGGTAGITAATHLYRKQEREYQRRRREIERAREAIGNRFYNNYYTQISGTRGVSEVENRRRPTYDKYENMEEEDDWTDVIIAYLKAIWDALLGRDEKSENSETDKGPTDTDNRSGMNEEQRL